MQNIDYITLQKFFEENIDFFIGARLQKIQQPTRRDFIFQIRNNGESRKLYINIFCCVKQSKPDSFAVFKRFVEKISVKKRVNVN